MRRCSIRLVPRRSVRRLWFTGAAWLALTMPAAAQDPCQTPPPVLYWPPVQCPTPDHRRMPQPPGAEQPKAAQPRPESVAPSVDPAPLAEPADFPQASAFASIGGAGGTVNMMGDTISGPALRCVSIPRTVLVPVTRQILPPPVTVMPPSFTTTFSALGFPPSVTVTPPPFTFTPTGTVIPPSVLVQPPPLVLPNGQVVQVPAFQATPAPVGVSAAAVTTQPPSFQASPPSVSVTAGPVTVQPQTFQAQPAAVTVTELVPTVIFEQKCIQILTAAARTSAFKIAENESPVPQDRAYFGFNYFNNVNEDVNFRFGDNVEHMWVAREIFGIEKTFFDGWTSVEARLPLATLGISSDVPGLSDTGTDIGDVSIGLKLALFRDIDNGGVISSGLVITLPTGPREFNPFNSVILQPWGGYRIFFGSNFYVHGFSSVAIPTDSRDVTLWFNDLAAGYFLYRNDDQCAFLNAVVPTFEVHVNTPLNHRGAFDFADPSGTPDWVVLTAAATMVMGRSTLAVGAGVPVTGPQPYDFELLAQYNLRF